MSPTRKRSGLMAGGLSLLLSLSIGGCSWTRSGSDTEDVQKALAKEGYDPGETDGQMGAGTREALKRFQQHEGLTESGEADVSTLKALGLDADRLTVPEGTGIRGRLDRTLDSAETRSGETFVLTVDRPVTVGESIAVPAGAEIIGRVTAVQSAKRPQKGGQMVLKAESLRVGGESVALRGRIAALKGKGSLKEDWKKIGIGAGLGAALGAVVDGGKGAAIGAAAGGGGTFLATKGEQIVLPAETVLTVTLEEAVSVPVNAPAVE